MNDGSRYEPREDTTLGDAQRFLAAIIASSQDAIIGKDLDGVIRSWSPGAERIYGYSPEEAIGRPVAFLAPPELQGEIAAIMDRVRRGERVEQLETARVDREGRRLGVSLTISPIRDEDGRIIGASTIARDVTLRARAALYDRLLAGASTWMDPARTPDQVLRGLADLLVPEIADACVVYAHREGSPAREGGGVLETLARAHVRPEGAALLAELDRLLPPDDPRHPARKAVGGRGVLHLREIGAEKLAEHAANERHRQALEALDPRSIVVVPVGARGQVAGVLAVAAVGDGSTHFGEGDLVGLRELAHRAALSVENARLAEQLRSDEERLRIALDAAGMGTWEWEIRTGTVRWSTTLEGIHGLEPGTFPGTLDAFRQDVHPDDAEAVRSAVERALAEEDAVYEIEYRIVRPDGETRWLAARGSVLRDEEGRPARMVGVCTDTTERRKAEAADRFLVEAGRVLASSLDYEATLAQVSALAVPDISDWCTVDLLEGERIRTVSVTHRNPEDREKLQELVRRHPPELDSPTGPGSVIRTGQPQLVREVEDSLLRTALPDAAAYEVARSLGIRSFMIVPLVSHGIRLGALTFAQSVSGRRFDETDLSTAVQLAARAAMAIQSARLYRESREAEVELAAERTRLQGAVRTRDEVLAFVSHDLRNLVGVMQTAARMLLELPLPEPKRRDVLVRTCSASEEAVRLIDDLLEVARGAEDGQALEIVAVHPSALTLKAVDAFREAAEGKGIELKHEPGEGLPELRADPHRVHRVISNLLSNAVKFTPRGGRVVVGVESAGDAVLFRVIDTGPGIAPEDQPRIFDPYWHAPRGDSSGTGLGLAIARRIVETHGGWIEVESKEGGGTELRFGLPVGGPGG